MAGVKCTYSLKMSFSSHDGLFGHQALMSMLDVRCYDNPMCQIVGNVHAGDVTLTVFVELDNTSREILLCVRWIRLFDDCAVVYSRITHGWPKEILRLWADHLEKHHQFNDDALSLRAIVDVILRGPIAGDKWITNCDSDHIGQHFTDTFTIMTGKQTHYIHV